MGSALCVIIMLLAGAAGPAELRGTVVGPDGKPITHATIIDDGTARQRAISDDLGFFAISDIDPSLKYDLLVLADGFRPALLKQIDPRRSDAKLKLETLPKNLNADQLVRGRVVDAGGQPIVGAHVGLSGY